MDNSNKVYNSSSGRYVKKTSKLGKLILAGKTPPKSSKSPKACSDSQIRNPSSQRCIKKTGRLARSLGNSPMTSTNSSARSVPSSLYPSYSSSSSSNPVALPVIPSAYVPPVVNTIPIAYGRDEKGKLKGLSDIFGLNEEENAVNTIKGVLKRRLQKTENANRNFASKELQAVIRRNIENKNVDNANKAATTLQTAFRNKLSKDRYQNAIMSKQTEKLKQLIDTSKNIVNEQKAASTIAQAYKNRLARKELQSLNTPAMKRQRSSRKFYKKANKTIMNSIPVLIGAGAATGMGLAGVF